MKKVHYDNLDLLKLIAIVMVIAQHVPLYNVDFLNDGSIIEYALKLFNEGVPIFLMVNGFLLLGKNELDIVKHYKKTLKMLLLVFIWAALLIAIGMVYDKTAFNLGLVIDLFFRIGEGNAVYTSHLWYMQCLIGIYIIYPLLWKTYKENYAWFKTAFLCLLAILFTKNFLAMLGSLVSYSGYSKMLFHIANYFDKFIPFAYEWQFLFFMMGGIVQHDMENITKNSGIWIFLGFLSWVLSVAFAVYVSNKDGVIYSPYCNASSMFEVFILLGLFCLSNYYHRKKALGHYILFVGNNTLGIYFIHTHVLRIVAESIPTTSLGLRFLNVIGTLLMSSVVVYVTKKIPKIDKLFSL